MILKIIISEANDARKLKSSRTAIMIKYFKKVSFKTRFTSNFRSNEARELKSLQTEPKEFYDLITQDSENLLLL